MTEEKQEFIHEAENAVEPKEEQTQELNIMDILQMELRRHMEVALEYKKKIDSAQTEYKKKYYTKKLKKNNTEALKVLTAIERVNKGSRKKSDAKKVETDDKHIVA